MMDSAAFKKMCGILGPSGLAVAARGSGESLVSTFAKSMESVHQMSAKPSIVDSAKEVEGPTLH